MTDFKSGDRVRVRDRNVRQYGYKTGDILCLISPFFGCTSHIGVWNAINLSTGQSATHIHEDELELITDTARVVGSPGLTIDPQYTFPSFRILVDDMLAVNKPKQSLKMKLSTAFKKFLNADLQAQVKAGFRDDGLNLTDAGRNAAIEVLLDTNTAAQTAFTQAATDKIAEDANK